MAKEGIKFCRNCRCNTKQIYRGKEPRTQEEKEFIRLAIIATLGGFLITETLMDKRPKLWECNNCSYISKF